LAALRWLSPEERMTCVLNTLEALDSQQQRLA
jgi:hypothetical protein